MPSAIWSLIADDKAGIASGVNNAVARIVDQRDARTDHFAEVVGRNVGCHANGNP